MSRIKSKTLFDLIHSLNKSEKRYFKIVVANSKDVDDKKIILLFDHIVQLDKFEDEATFNKVPNIKQTQISNLKAYLFEKVLQVLRMYHISKVKDIQIREQIDFTQILLERRLYASAKKCMEKAKKMAQANLNLELQLELLKLEKNVVMQNVADAERNVDLIVEEVKLLNGQIYNINTFTNLSIKLNSYYTRTGFVRDEQDEIKIKEFFNTNISSYQEHDLSTIEKLSLYRLYIGYYFFLQDFEQGYIYSKRLEATFDNSVALIESMPDDYIKALNNLLIAQNKLFKYHEFVETNIKLQSVAQMPNVRINENIRIKLLKYFYSHEINKYFMTGNFEEGVKTVVVQQAADLSALLGVLDKHSSLVLNYKIACLYFGAGNFNFAIRSLNKIINSHSTDLREDLHCFARILNLVCHFELGNFDVIRHYIISTYRFLLKKDDLRLFQKYVLQFIKNLTKENYEQNLISEFINLKTQLLPLVESPYEKRAFIYFDIISWLESKVQKKSVQQIITDKFSSRIN